MCFAHSRSPSLSPKYDEEDGSVVEENNHQGLYISDAIHRHIDTVYLNFDANSEEGILAFIYETGDETLIVYTSDEAMEICNEPFTEFSEYITCV